MGSFNVHMVLPLLWLAFAGPIPNNILTILRIFNKKMFRWTVNKSNFWAIPEDSRNLSAQKDRGPLTVIAELIGVGLGALCVKLLGLTYFSQNAPGDFSLKYLRCLHFAINDKWITEIVFGNPTEMQDPRLPLTLAGINWHLPGASELRSHNFYLSSKYCGPHAWG